MSVKASSQVSMLDITDAYSVTLTSEAFAFVGNTSGAPSGLSCATQVIAYCGTQRCSKVTIGTVSCPSGITASISNNGSNAPTITFTTTATITAACEATIPVTVDGITINKKFSFAVAKQGAQGVAGNDGRNATYITVSGTNYDAIVGIDKNYSYISINGTKYDFNPGRGHTLAVINPSNGAVESIQSYDTYYSPELLDSPLNNVEAGKIICLFTADASALTQMSRNILIECGSSMTDTWGQYRMTHVFIGMKGLSRGNAYEWIGSGTSATNAITAYYTPSGIVLNGRVGATGNGVSSSTVDYQVSSSGTTIPTGTWQPSVPSVSPGQYLWTRTILKYTNGSSSSASYSVGRMGTNGTNGTNGSDGRGIKSTVVTYQAGSSGTSAPTGIWTSSVPATSASAPYLWSKTVITYTDNNAPSTTYSVGSTPEGIVVGGRNLWINSSKYREGTPFSTTSASIDNAYSIFDNRSIYSKEKFKTGDVITIQGKSNLPWSKTHGGSSSSKGTVGYWLYLGTYDQVLYGGFTTPVFLPGDGSSTSFKYTYTIPTVGSLSDIYIGFRFNSYSDGSTSHTAKFWDIKLEKGNKATDWTPAPEDTEAEISALATRVANAETSITKSNEAIELRATKTEVAQTYATKTDVNNIQVGGRNLIRNSHSTEVTYTYPSTGIVDRFYGVSTVPLNAGIYTLSFWAKSTVNGDKLRVHLYNPSNIISAIGSQGQINNNPDGNCDFTLSTTLTKYWVTYKVPKDNSTRSFIIPRVGPGVGVTGSGTLTFKWEKLEEGNKATDWTPAPEDLETRVTTAESSIKQTANKVSLVVKSGDSESNMVLTDKVCELVANNINLKGRITISGLNSDTQTKINNGNDAYNWKTSGDGSKLLSMVKTWTGNAAISNTTTIQGGWIATNTITADKIAIGDFTNYCDLNQSTASRYGFTVVADSSASNNPWLQMNYLQRDTGICPNGYVNYKCNGGESFRIKFQVSSTVKENSSGNFMDINVGLYCRTDTGANVWVIPYGVTSDANGTVKTVSAVATLPTNVRTFSVYLQIGGSAPFSGVCKVRNISVTKMSSGELIVDGAITADKLNVTSLSAITANLGYVTAGDINIGGGKFHVDPSGNLTATSATITGTISSSTISGGSININNKKFYVDSGGNVEMSGTITIGKYTASSPGITICGAVMASDANSAFYISHSNAIWLQPASSGNTTTRIYIDDDYIKLSSDKGGGSPSHGSFTVTSSIMSFNCNGDYFNNSFSVTSSGITLSGPTTIKATATTNAIIPDANATYALGEGGSKGWSNIYIGNASSTYNGLRIINGTTNYNLCGINSSNTMIFGDASWTPYIYVKNTSKPSSGAVQSFTIGDNGSTTINDTHVWLYGRNDTTSRYIGSYLVYARTYGSAANVVVTNNGVLGRSTSSSKRYKHDIREFSVDEISCLYDLPLKKFKYNNDYISKDDEYYNKDLYGFIVEDLDEVLPISVQHNLDDDAEYTIPEMWNNNIIVPCLLKLIQDLNNRLKKVEEGKEN